MGYNVENFVYSRQLLMSNNHPLSPDKKLMVLFRVEPGCLGPKGKDLIDEFCRFAQKGVANIDADFVHWDIVARHDKALPELEYKIRDKKLSHDKAAKYLALFDKSLDEFEQHLNDQLGLLIEIYLKRQSK